MRATVQSWLLMDQYFTCQKYHHRLCFGLFKRCLFTLWKIMHMENSPLFKNRSVEKLNFANMSITMRKLAQLTELSKELCTFFT